jgi:outer membrane biosynthesis protein TonB
MQYVAARLLDLAFIGALIFLNVYKGDEAGGRSGTMRSTTMRSGSMRSASNISDASPPILKQQQQFQQQQLPSPLPPSPPPSPPPPQQQRQEQQQQEQQQQQQQQQHDGSQKDDAAAPDQQNSQGSPADDLHCPSAPLTASGSIGTYQSTLKPMSSTTSSKVLTLEDIDKPGALLASLLLRPDADSAAAALEVGVSLQSKRLRLDASTTDCAHPGLYHHLAVA